MSVVQSSARLCWAPPVRLQSLRHPTRCTGAITFYPGRAPPPIRFNYPARDPNELYETPRNMVGQSRFYRLRVMPCFGRPGAQPVAGRKTRNHWPFAVGCEDLADVPVIHGLRVAGFRAALQRGVSRQASVCWASRLRGRGHPAGSWNVLLAGTIVAARFWSATHIWWARYGPQLWWCRSWP